ncbi:MAG: hypothetical protein ACR2LR_24430 [Hassallia sp.]
MARKTRVKLCDRCSQSAPILYRVKYEENSEWVFICHQCWDQVSQDNPFYVYGGTWKAQKK